MWSLPWPIAARIVPRLPAGIQRFREVDTWDSAALLSREYPAAYSHEDVPLDLSVVRTDVLRSRWVELVAAFGVALASAEKSRFVRVVDFGGHLGAAYEVVSQAYPDFTFEWTVVETPDVVCLAREKGPKGVVFLSDLDEALGEPVDVTLAAASLNYVAEPMSLASALRCSSQASIFTRLPLWPIASATPAVQRIRGRRRGYSYPTWFFSESQFLRWAEHKSEILLRFEVPGDRAFFRGSYRTYQGLVLYNVERH